LDQHHHQHSKDNPFSILYGFESVKRKSCWMNGYTGGWLYLGATTRSVPKRILLVVSSLISRAIDRKIMWLLRENANTKNSLFKKTKSLFLITE
jgi:hypothetical protein